MEFGVQGPGDEEAEFGFRPTLGEMAELTLPSLLPDLPMAADLPDEGPKTPCPFVVRTCDPSL